MEERAWGTLGGGTFPAPDPVLMYARSRTRTPARCILPAQRERLPTEEAFRYVKLVAGGIERGTRAVLKNPWLLFGLIGVSLLARLLFAPPNKQKSYRAPASLATPKGRRPRMQ